MYVMGVWMTILVDWQIEEAISSGRIGITPFRSENVQPNSLDVHLSNSFGVYQMSKEPIKPYDEESVLKDLRTFEQDQVWLMPGQFMLAETLEWIELPDNVCCTIEGKSSLARLGLAIHQTGGWVDAGFTGSLTLEMTNVMCKPIELYCGMPIAQLVFFEVEYAKIPYRLKKDAKYCGQKGAQPSKFFENKRVRK